MARMLTGLALAADVLRAAPIARSGWSPRSEEELESEIHAWLEKTGWEARRQERVKGDPSRYDIVARQRTGPCADGPVRIEVKMRLTGASYRQFDRYLRCPGPLLVAGWKTTARAARDLRDLRDDVPDRFDFVVLGREAPLA